MSGRVRSSLRHGKHNRFRPLELLLVHGEVLHVTHPGDHAKDILQRPHFPHHLELGQEVVEIERGRPQLPLHPRGFLFVDRFRRFLDQADDVAHPENPARQAIGHERLELIELLADAGELDRTLRDLAHRERRAAARVAIELGQNDAGDAQRLVKMRGHADRLLAGGRVGDEQDFLRLQEFLEPL